MKLAQTGKLGKLRTLHASIYEPKTRYDWLPAEPKPSIEEVDWERWLGPCPERPFNKEYMIKWIWPRYYDFSAGCGLLDWGAHTVDLCQMANKSDGTSPLEFTPGKDKITARYANGVELVLDYVNKRTSSYYQTPVGSCSVRFEGDLGWVETGDAGSIKVSSSLKDELINVRRSEVGINAASHARNFFDCVKSRGQTAANPHVMRYSHIACFGASIAWERRGKVSFDPVRKTFIGDDQANRLCSRAIRSPWHI